MGQGDAAHLAPAERRAPVGSFEGSASGLIYLVEDSPVQARFMATQLSYFGYEVEHFTTTAACIEALTQYIPRVVLTDISLVDDDIQGLQAVPIYKTCGKVPPHVVVLSSHTDFETRLKAVQVGVDAYFVKPANVPQLVDKIDRLTRAIPDEPVKVLVVDDQQVAVSYYSAAMRRSGMLAIGTTEPRKVLDLMSEHRPDVVLCDLQMPGCTGFELAQVLRQIELFVNVPVVFLTGADTDAIRQIDSLRNGGDEFLSKTMDREFIASVVRARALRARALDRYMFRDGMTGLYKHSALKENLVRELGRGKREGTEVTFALVDIDFFKSVNDTYGHAMGDRVIISLARLLQQNLRPADIVGRYGGEEFAVVLPDCSLEQAAAVMRRLCRQFSEVRHSADGRSFNVTFSCGVATSRVYGEPGTLIEQADAALYEAKRGGRNQVCTAD